MGEEHETKRGRHGIAPGTPVFPTRSVRIVITTAWSSGPLVHP